MNLRLLLNLLKETTICFKDADPTESRIRCTLLFTILKKLNRLAHMRCKKARERTQEVCALDVLDFR